MSEVTIMEQGFLYGYYDEQGKHIAIVHRNTPKETIERLKEKFDEVKYEE